MEPTGDLKARASAGARRARESAREADWRSPLARFGLVAKGVLYAALGVLAIRFAMSGGGEEASKEGALQLVASQPFGQVLLGLLTAGLFALAIWQGLIAFTGDPVEGDDGKARFKFGVKSIVYLATAVTAATMLIGVATSSGGGKQEAAATVMAWPGGRWIVGIVGIALFGFALEQLWAHGGKERFMERLDRRKMGSAVANGVETVGRVGYAARGVVLALVGAFFVTAAIQHDPSEAQGLPGALRTLAAQRWGTVLLWIVAVGLVLYGVFCTAEARWRRAA